MNPDELQSAVELALSKHQADSREREHWFSTTLRSIGDAVISTDAAGCITFMNPIAEQLTGVLTVQAAGRHVTEVLRWVDQSGQSAAVHPIQRVLHAGERVEGHGIIVGREGSECPVSDIAAPILDDSGQLLGAVMVFRDVRGQRRLERLLELSNRMASLGTLAAGVCHEINNPLTFVVGNLGLALRKVEACSDSALRGELSRLLETCLLGANRVGQIVSDLRTFARPSADKPPATQVADALSWALQVALPTVEGRARLTRKIERVPAVLADETRLSQVFINLLINAAHAMRSDNAEDNQISVHAFTGDDGWAVIDVADNGIGMSAEVCSHIFEPFFTTKQASSGTGLGLSICHGILTSLGGSIEVESTVGAGSRFRVRLPPTYTVSGSRSPSAEPEPTPEDPKGTILVIDDEALIREFTTEILVLAGHTVTECGSGEEALALIAGGKRFDIILCDLVMPVMDGAAVFEAVRQRSAEQAERMFFISGGACTPHTSEFVSTRAAPLLAKPFSPDELQSSVRLMLRARGSVQPAR